METGGVRCSARPASAAGAPPRRPTHEVDVDNSPIAKSAALIASLFSPCNLLLEKLSKSLIPHSNYPLFRHSVPVFVGIFPVFVAGSIVAAWRTRLELPSGSRLTFESRRGFPGAVVAISITCGSRVKRGSDIPCPPASVPWATSLSAVKFGDRFSTTAFLADLGHGVFAVSAAHVFKQYLADKRSAIAIGCQLVDHV